MGKYWARVRWQVGIILVITVIWFAPLVCSIPMVRHGRPLLTVAYVACALLSVSVIWLPEG